MTNRVKSNQIKKFACFTFTPFVVLIVFTFVFLNGCTSGSPYVSSRFGETLGRSYPHTGTDYDVPWGTPVLAVSDGTVHSAFFHHEDGNRIIIQHTPELRTIYCHLKKMLVSTGQYVKRGEVIALSGNTGSLTGSNPHLHFQVNKGRGWGSPTNPYPSYWYGEKGKPLAYDPNFLYPSDRDIFIHPIAFGPYRSIAKEIAKEKIKEIESQ